jgi:2,3-bisphosphoglycerate-independent phosphoglycerate mutase
MFGLEKFFHQKPQNRQIKPVMLIIMDGWGIAPPSRGNVIAQTKLKNLERFLADYPHTELIAAGESVGLPANEVGNTEVGHLTIGSGRVTYQGLKRINMSIEDGTFTRNKAFRSAVEHVKKNNSKLHVMGLLSSGNVHAAIPHFYGILEFCQQAGIKDVFVHAFTDGRDAPPKESLNLFAQVEQRMISLQTGQFATLSGRYYAMDRDRRWERIQKAYEAIVEGKGFTANSWKEAIEAGYTKGLSDELLEPTVILKDGKPIATIDDHDAVIFFNFRIDRPRELTMALTMPDFEDLDISKFGYNDTENRQHAKSLDRSKPFTRNKKLQDVFFVTMTKYHENIPVGAVAFDTPFVDTPLGEVLAQNNLKQLRMAESEKERFVTYYFNGHKEEIYQGEEHLITPSPKVATYDKRPEMSVFKQVANFKRQLYQDKHHFFVMNIANPDMVAHTGNLPATIKAIQATDKAVGEMVDAVLECGGTVFITADHGNAEELITYPSTSFFFTTSAGIANTDHSNNPVPLIIVNESLKQSGKEMKKGGLSDIAPTILAYMGLPIPPHMTGQNLFVESKKEKLST